MVRMVEGMSEVRGVRIIVAGLNPGITELLGTCQVIQVNHKYIFMICMFC